MTEGSSAGPKGGKKGRKHGRNKAECQAYKANNSAAYRKTRGIARHLVNYHGNDAVAIVALQSICKADHKTAKAFSGVTGTVEPGYIRTMRFHAKRAAKARRQMDRAEANAKTAELAKDSKAGAVAHATLIKAQRYLNHYASP